MFGKLPGLSLLSACNHQFCWPRRTETGEYYQACVICGQEYAYDWQRMQRTRKLRGSRRNAKHSWRPRARRLACNLPVVFQTKDQQEWLEGSSINLSQWGMLLRVPIAIEPGTTLHMRFSLPAGLLEAEATQIAAVGRVVRIQSDEAGLAAGITFLTSLVVHQARP